MKHIFGLYRPGHSRLHRLGVGRKYVLLLVLTVPPLVVQQPWMTLATLVAVIGLLGGTRLPLPGALALPAGVVLLLAMLLAYQVLVGAPTAGVVVAGNLLVALYASRLLTLTTPGPVLIDALVVACRPLRLLGVDPERVGLGVALMVRSVPVLLGAFGTVREAARARGLERNAFAQVAPVVVQAVAYAKATGDALAARGLGETNS